MENKLYTITAEQLRKIQKIYILGDIHGDYLPFSKYLENIDFRQNILVFLGDYADRGKYGIETIDIVSKLITKYPDHVIALKGNHEDYLPDGNPAFSPCDLIREVRRKRGNWDKYYKTIFIPFIEKLYISALLPGEILFVHGGISGKIRCLEDLQNPSEDIERDILWSDPFEKNEENDAQDEYESFRGLGVLFSQTITENLLNLCNVKKIIRSHQPRLAENGIYYNHNEQVITVSSTSVYNGKPCILIINPGDNFTMSTEMI